jgi:hypothetical protein
MQYSILHPGYFSFPMKGYQTPFGHQSLTMLSYSCADSCLSSLILPGDSNTAGGSVTFACFDLLAMRLQL